MEKLWFVEAEQRKSRGFLLFYILMGGMIASMIAALGEFLYRSRIEARKAKGDTLVGSFAVAYYFVEFSHKIQKNLKSALSSQLRLSIQGGAVAPPGSQSHEALKRQQVNPHTMNK